MLAAGCLLSAVLHADGGAADGWADVVRAERDAGRPLPLLSQYMNDFDLDLAYAVQRELVTTDLAARAIAGYKAGFTSAAAQRRFGLTAPVSGVLPAGGARDSGAVIALADHPNLMIEIEIGFVLRSAITRPMKSVADLRTYVREARPVVELPALGFESPTGFTAQDLVATNVGAALWLAGAPLPVAALDEVNALEVTLAQGAEIVDSGRGSNAMGDQLEALRWLVNHLQAQGWPLRPGHLLITGTLGRINPARPGRWQARYGDLARLEFEIVERARAQASAR